MMRNIRSRWNSGTTRMLLTVAAAIFGIAALNSGPADAIPYWARKYEMNCGTCHYQQPKLNNFGRWFAARGYRLSDNEPPDTSLKDVKTWPISIKVEAWGVAKNTAAASTDFQLHGMEVLSAGALPGGASYFFEKYFEERGDFASAGDVYVRFPFGKKGYFQAGQFTVLTHIPDPNRVTVTRNLVYNTKASIGGKTNSVRLRDRQRGVEFGWGSPQGTSNISVSVSNGNATGKEVSDVADDNDTKSVLLSGYTGLGGRFSFGGFHYIGNTAAAGKDKNRFTRTGLTFTSNPGPRWNLELIAMSGRDKNLFDDKGATRVHSAAGSFEADYLLGPGVAAYARWGQWRTGASNRFPVKSTEWTVGYSRMLHDYVKWTAEFQAVPGKSNDMFLMELELDL